MLFWLPQRQFSDFPSQYVSWHQALLLSPFKEANLLMALTVFIYYLKIYQSEMGGGGRGRPISLSSRQEVETLPRKNKNINKQTKKDFTNQSSSYEGNVYEIYYHCDSFWIRTRPASLGVNSRVPKPITAFRLIICSLALPVQTKILQAGGHEQKTKNVGGPSPATTWPYRSLSRFMEIWTLPTWLVQANPHILGEVHILGVNHKEH